MILGYYDESDGTSHLTVEQGTTVLDDWDADHTEQNHNDDEAPYNYVSAETLINRTVGTGVQVNPGETFTITATEGVFEHARIDYLDFEHTTDSSLDFRVEAESMERLVSAPTFLFQAEEEMTLTNFIVQTETNGYGEGYISLQGTPTGTTGTATFDFNGPSGDYDVIVTYLDENDGQSSFQL